MKRIFLLLVVGLAGCSHELQPVIPDATVDAGIDGGNAEMADPAMVCWRSCDDAHPCNPSVWGVCVAGCCVCRPPDGGTCPATPSP